MRRGLDMDITVLSALVPFAVRILAELDMFLRSKLSCNR